MRVSFFFSFLHIFNDLVVSLLFFLSLGHNYGTEVFLLLTPSIIKLLKEPFQVVSSHPPPPFFLFGEGGGGAL